MMTKKEKLQILQAGASAYIVSSVIAYIKEGGIQFINTSEAWALKVYKSFGVIDVFRMEGALKNLDVFGADWPFLVVGMFSSGIAIVVIKVIHYFKEEEEKPAVKKTEKGFKVKMKKEVPQFEWKEENKPTT